MTPHQLRAIINRLGLSQLGAARIMGIGDRTIRRWCRGEQDVAPAGERVLWLVELLATMGQPPSRIEKFLASRCDETRKEAEDQKRALSEEKRP